MNQTGEGYTSRTRACSDRLLVSAVCGPGLLLLLTVAGCSSLSKDASNTVASITITNHSYLEIASATETVFARHEFKGGRSGSSQLTFEKPGSTLDAVVRGDWLDRKVIERAVITIRQQRENRMLVDCDARLVAAAGDSVFEESYRIWGTDKKHYQEMLNEIQAIVDRGPFPTNSPAATPPPGRAGG
ncbi:MAG TPA: hypothetical protein VLU94_02515 [Candidatus Nitrosotalea sp.]|nr:hypothetical protein [Candidatus Nitrosotalea sp.]